MLETIPRLELIPDTREIRQEKEGRIRRMKVSALKQEIYERERESTRSARYMETQIDIKKRGIITREKTM